MNTSDINNLLEKYFKGTSTQEENAMLETWYMRYENKSLAEVGDEERIQQLEKIRVHLQQHSTQVKATKLWPRIIGVAAAVVAIAFGIWFYTSRHPDADQALAEYKNDVAPGGNRATLTANGKTISLNEEKTGVLIGDELKYNDGSALSGLRPSLREGKSSVMTASTPRGGTYSIILQDGTKVWLNADSKLEFLSNYLNKAQRIVRLIGEAYFEVAKDAKRPFIVQSAGQIVTVLGTHFNISAYKDEDVKTTLLKGSVRVETFSHGPTPSSRGTGGSMKNDGKNDKAIILKPSQQATLDKTFKIRLQTLLDAERAIAWAGVKGKPVFVFNSEDLPSLLRKISRWYDVEVIDKTTKKSDPSLNGMVRRDAPLSSVVKMLEATQSFHFKIEGRKLIVTDWR